MPQYSLARWKADGEAPIVVLARFDAGVWEDDGRGHRKKEMLYTDDEGDRILLYDVEAYCAECKKLESGIYMVHDRLWAKYGNGDGRLCPPCLGKRMGRHLTQADLNDAPCNLMWFSTDESLR